ncbi:MAG: SPASM domain-containing protein [Halanaerobiales bacterium]|nr:SPASM domain-containing protein [Halanaerobiales bacterium]
MELPNLVDTDLKFFKVQDRNYVFDIPSSTLFEIYPDIKSILEKSIHQNSISYLEELEKEFNFLDWVEIIGELKHMIDHRHLTIHSSKIIPYELKEQNLNCITLHLCHDCNMQCAYCYQKEENFDKEPKYMSEEVAKKSIEFLFKKAHEDRIQLNLSGGEPLLNVDLIEFIIKIGRENEEKYEKELDIALFTNGTILNHRILKILAEGQVELIIHQDGQLEDNNKIDCLELLKDSGIQYQIKGLIHHYNLPNFLDTLKLYEKKGYSSINMEILGTKPENEYALTSKDIEVLKEYMSTFFERYKMGDPFVQRLYHVSLVMDLIKNRKNYGYACGTGKNYFCIAPSGDIYPCHLLVNKSEFQLGNVLKDTFNQKLRKNFYEPLHVLNREDCKRCWARYLCGGGCVGENFLVNNNLSDRYTTRCELTKFILEKAIETYCSSLAEEDKLILKHERRKKGREIYKIS